MAKLSKIDVAKAIGVSRQTLYNYLKDGCLSVDIARYEKRPC
jgi:DNA-binding XRE family transcriptional regulator